MHRFIVGTGRCGSTLLSRMLAQNPEVLSVFEFLNGLDATRRLSPTPISGREYADLLCAEQPFLTRVYQCGYEVPEVRYPFDALGARYRRGDPLPWVLVAMLPALSAEPDALYDEMVGFLHGLPTRPPIEQHLALFAWLGERVGRSVWVERSGASIEYMGTLARSFEEARFLHIHRDGEEAALSMREHHAFRLAIMLVHRLSADGGGTSGRPVPEPLPGADRELCTLLASRPPAHLFGRWWTEQLSRGFRSLQEVAPDCYHEVTFEALIETPEQTLEEVALFLDLPDPRGPWRGKAAGLVRGAPPVRAPDLPAPELAALREACRPGNLLLGRE